MVDLEASWVSLQGLTPWQGGVIWLLRKALTQKTRGRCEEEKKEPETMIIWRAEENVYGSYREEAFMQVCKGQDASGRNSQETKEGILENEKRYSNNILVKELEDKTENASESRVKGQK